MSESLVEIIANILKAAKRSDFAGYDPFDGLNSFFSITPKIKKGLLGLAWIQFHKRSVLNLRPLLGIPKMRNPKGVGLFVLGLLEDYKRTKDASYLENAVRLGDWLLLRQSNRAVWTHSCWGFPIFTYTLVDFASCGVVFPSASLLTPM